MAGRRRIKSQSKYFYTKTWTQRHDVAFLNTLAFEADLGYPHTHPSKPCMRTIKYAMRVVNGFSSTQFGIDFYTEKLNFLRQRYRTFQRILEDGSFDWNPDTNRVLGSKEAWDRLFQENPFAKAHWWRGERRYGLLHTIFEGNGKQIDEDWENSDSDVPADTDGVVQIDGEEGEFICLGEKDVVAEPSEIIDINSSDSGDEP